VKGKGFEIELGCTLGGIGNCFALSVEEWGIKVRKLS
jgi:hypothetical protein